METPSEGLALAAFARAASRVPAYKTLLGEAGIVAGNVRNFRDFERLPILRKRDTFQRFGIADLCVDGELGPLSSVLTSSGHSGIFAFGLTEANGGTHAARQIDDILDHLFGVRSRTTLLINCLPMGVKVPTEVCTLAETSVRPDMVVGLARAFGPHFGQIILVGETAFIKNALELGARAGIDWKRHVIQVVVGEEPLAENARKYLETLLGIDGRRVDEGIVMSSMGVAELGLNIFSEAPPKGLLTRVRRLLHEDEALRRDVLGPSDWVPSLFTYDPRRIGVEFDSLGQLVLTTLDLGARIPLIRYATGDLGRALRIPERLRPAFDRAGVSWSALEGLPIVAVQGRNEYVMAKEGRVFPEAVKEGIYHDHGLAELTTANFRLASGSERARVRIQLGPSVTPSPDLPERFREAISYYVRQPIEVTCEAYETFGSGMTLDYERKFSYLGR